jgi:hypothetical protein
MPFDTFEQLAHALRAELGVPLDAPGTGAASAFTSCAAFDVDGASIALCAFTDQPRLAYLLCDHGPLPADGGAVMQRLLQVNFLTFRGNGGSYCIDPAHDNLVLMQAIELAVADARDVAQSVARMAESARDFREGRFG